MRVLKLPLQDRLVISNRSISLDKSIQETREHKPGIESLIQPSPSINHLTRIRKVSMSAINLNSQFQFPLQSQSTCQLQSPLQSQTTLRLKSQLNHPLESIERQRKKNRLKSSFKGTCPSCRAFHFSADRQQQYLRKSFTKVRTVGDNSNNSNNSKNLKNNSDTSPSPSRLSASISENPYPSSDSPSYGKESSSSTDILVTDVTEGGKGGGGGLGFPSPQDRLKIILSTALAFVICNMDKVNMSVAIIPMAQQLGWSNSVAGLVQSSFFFGYAMSQLPGGWLAQRFSGRTVLLSGVLVWSVGTAIVPFVASYVPILVLVRLLIGLGEGVAPPAATDLIAQLVPKEERSRAVATVFGGLNVGSVAGLILAPICIQQFGWESVFYIFGLAGVVWWLAFRSSADSKPTTQSKNGSIHGGKLIDGNGYKGTTSIHHHSLSSVKEVGKQVPWRFFFESPAFLALIWAHFCNDWGKYALQSWLPSYYKSALNLDLIHASQIAILPPVLSVILSGMAAWVADSLIKKGVDITTVRKLMQTISFLAPAICLSIVCGLEVTSQPWLVVTLLSLGLGLSSFSLAGLYCTHQDMSPKYAGILLGITNTAGAIPGFLGTALTGVLFDATNSWKFSLFLPAIIFYLAGALVWVMYASSKPQDFDAMREQYST